MYQVHGFNRPGSFRESRVGIGTLALGMAAAFVAGAIGFSLVDDSSVTVPPAAITAGGQDHTVAEDGRGGGITSVGRTPLTRELFVDDFVAVPASRSGPLTRELFMDDFVAVPASRSGPLTRELFVDDFVAVPASRSGPLTRELLVDDFVAVQ